MNSPIVYNDLLIAGEVAAFHYRNGTPLWNYHPQLPVQDAKHVRIDSYLPLTAGNSTVILAINSMESESFNNLSGSATRSPGNTRTVLSYKASANELSGTLIALDAASGKERWIQKTPTLIQHAPVISGDRVFIGGNGSVEAYRLTDGSKIWKTDLPGYQRAVAADSEFLIADDRFGQNLTALRLEDGKTGWIYQSPQRSRSMSVSDHFLYIVGDKPAYALVVVDVKTGKQIWKQDMPADWVSPSQPVLSGNMIYITTMTGTTYAFSHSNSSLGPDPWPHPLPTSGIVLTIGAIFCIFALTRRRS